MTPDQIRQFVEETRKLLPATTSLCISAHDGMGRIETADRAQFESILNCIRALPRALDIIDELENTAHAQTDKIVEVMEDRALLITELADLRRIKEAAEKWLTVRNGDDDMECYEANAAEEILAGRGPK